MDATEAITVIGHDTAMCGDPKIWFPMRVTYGREMKHLWLRINGSRFMVKNILRALWQFCRYVFWPQWGNKLVHD